ncbi:MAG: hypothetical protein II922_06010 [Succinimonas sp.]|nr:hypothetical protein [Succinimonas sp.]
MRVIKAGSEAGNSSGLRSFQNKENAMNSMRNIRNRKNPLAAAALLKSSVTPPLGDPLPFPPWPILW